MPAVFGVLVVSGVLAVAEVLVVSDVLVVFGCPEVNFDFQIGLALPCLDSKYEI